MDEYDIPVGAYWPDAIDEALAASDVVIGLLSPDAVASRNVKNEWDWALQNDKRLLLVLVRPCVIPHRYVSLNYIDATGPDPVGALTALVEELKPPRQGLAAKPPETRYALSGDLSIAYQVFGAGPVDLVVTPGFVSNIDWIWDDPAMTRFYEGLAAFARVIAFDKRGTGLSDRTAGVPSLEQRIDDLRAVMDAADAPQAVMMGISEGGSRPYSSPPATRSVRPRWCSTAPSPARHRPGCRRKSCGVRSKHSWRPGGAMPARWPPGSRRAWPAIAGSSSGSPVTPVPPPVPARSSRCGA